MSQAAISVKSNQRVSTNRRARYSNFNELDYLAQRYSGDPLVQKFSGKFKRNCEEANNKIRKHYVQNELIRWAIFKKLFSVFCQHVEYYSISKDRNEKYYSKKYSLHDICRWECHVYDCISTCKKQTLWTYVVDEGVNPRNRLTTSQNITPACKFMTSTLYQKNIAIFCITLKFFCLLMTQEINNWKRKRKKYVEIKENFQIYDDFTEWKQPLMGTQFSLTISGYNSYVSFRNEFAWKRLEVFITVRWRNMSRILRISQLFVSKKKIVV